MGDPKRPTQIGGGFVDGETIVIPTVPGGQPAVVQVRAWEAEKGPSYELARARGGRFGNSEMLEAMPSTPPPLELTGLKSFHLQPGSPTFSVGTIRARERLPDGTKVWTLEGQPDSIYRSEKATDDFSWQPLLIITNVADQTSFVDPTGTTADRSFYRARILD